MTSLHPIITIHHANVLTLPVLIPVALRIVILVPLTGVLVRYRVNYNPNELQLGLKGGTQPYTGPIIRSYLTMMGRVYRIEGIQGLYKGLMPTVLSTFLMIAFVLLAPDVPKIHHGILDSLMYSMLMMLISLPTTVLTYRAITTPYRLSYFNIVQAFRVLLTPKERRHPWVIYLTPGLLAAQILQINIMVGLVSLYPVILPYIRAILPTALYTLICVAIVALATVVLTPLEVIATRLTIQRNHASAEYTSVSQEIGGDTEDVPVYSNEEDVIGLRSEGNPYPGLVDCVKRIVDEEGWTALYCAWWLTASVCWETVF